MYRYDKLYNQAVTEGALLEMPEAFTRAHDVAQKRTIFTRPDVLAREGAILQSGISTLIEQYRAEMDRLHDGITDDIASLVATAEESREYIFPQRDAIILLASELEKELNSGAYTSVTTLKKLATISHAHRLSAEGDLDLVKRKIVLQDILWLKHELRFLDSFYRFNRDVELTFDRSLAPKFSKLFTREFLEKTSVADLRAAFEASSKPLTEYRTESGKLRVVDREKRTTMVEKEKEKWWERIPPIAPFSDLYAQIYVSLKNQEMYVYEDGELILSTPITSGRRDFETVRGKFQIYTKERGHLMKSPFPEEDYELWVDYWLPFYGAYGIHDACNSTDCWRTRFGGASYVYNGSHGCVNTPYNAVKFIYGWSRVGTTVYIQ